MSWVYFLRRQDGAIKIGYSAQPRVRLATLRGEHGELDVLALTPGGRDLEASLHERFPEARIGRTEWFAPCEALVALVRDLPALTVDDVDQRVRLHVRLEPELHRAVKVRAAQEGVTVEELVTALVVTGMRWMGQPAK